MMAEMSDFEVRANDIWTGISTVKNRVEDFGYASGGNETMSNVIGMFITWLTASEEVRQNSLGKIGSFTSTVIKELPEDDDPSWKKYIGKPLGTLKQRTKSLWGIRIAFTHGNGDIDNITNPVNKEYARLAVKFLPGVKLDGTILELNSSISNHAIRTIIQIQELLS
jgi:hypothetical protein